MSSLEQGFCRSRLWQTFTRQVALPWALGRVDLHGDVLELGSGSGATAAELLDRYPDVRITASDVDPAMRAAARHRLTRYGDRAHVREADATRLPFDAASFDGVISFIVLHHVIDWERALAEIARVLRPGGILAGYDLVESRLSRLTHRLDRSPHRLATEAALRARLGELPFVDIAVEPSLAGLVTRFRATRSVDARG